ncbi:hypothetical protein SERLA73DRAFT_129152 [Serpula lacrymans var. lacrymans S7.3]|uniref:Uncharacterized protein n=2 Tax=Serpula lacrymans var. lacrymans TaxID=341189 RepID=F8PFJ3_SERL3|nr:uncharacterized protein SERLADRAFT_376843 [Serpula lacrymans var. lacrymans S7.9]EGO05282.1 hypothetical protein SERLA73DRAFT_129152 [Serpula lacrymans var. lacrymans S7.3]EGO31139.1 hypothetical protein SERLADRAFT_376843 [Serpula lacrymans var. lacrymans S7.9]
MKNSEQTVKRRIFVPQTAACLRIVQRAASCTILRIFRFTPQEQTWQYEISMLEYLKASLQHAHA